MDRSRLLTSVLLVLFFLIALSVALYAERAGAPQIPPVYVQPAPDIEFLWNIEDTRSESSDPLVTYLENNGSPLGYDAGSNTFYCTLGMETGSEWPEISLCAPEAEGVSICFSDDYTYDWCDQAISEGYAYELMAYTDTEYAYFYLVFTGLPIVSLHTQEAIGDDYVPAYASVSSAEYEPIESLAKAHIRGSIFHVDEVKKSYRIEFHRINQQGRDKKNPLSVLGMPQDSDWLLISDSTTEPPIRNHLAFDMWRKWNEDGDAFCLLESRLVEVFVNNEFMGMYQLMQRIDTDTEIERMGGSTATDCAFRVRPPADAEEERLIKDYKDTADVHIELRKPPENYTEEGAFEILEPYIELADVKQGLLDDERFLEQLEIHMDVEDMLSYYLFSQAISMWEDNVYNNLYIWAIKDGDHYRYWFAPWDMDRSFYLAHAQCHLPLLEGEDGVCIELRIPVRLLNMDGLDSREILWSLWEEKRSTILSDDAVYQWFSDLEALVNDSGAYARDTAKWRGAPENLNIGELCSYALQHLGTLDRFMRESWPYGEYTPN